VLQIPTSDKTKIIWVVTVGLVLAAIGFLVYSITVPESVGREAAEWSIQLGVIVGVGGGVKYLLDSARESNRGEAQRLEKANERLRERRRQRIDFLRRVRGCHAALDIARNLIRAHNTQNTWFEQSRELMKIRLELEEIGEDLKTTNRLFRENDREIADALEEIDCYLGKLQGEYVKFKPAADKHALKKETQNLDYSVDELDLKWADDFRNAGPEFEKGYGRPLTIVKSTMRQYIFSEEDADDQVPGCGRSISKSRAA
jgi:hypothetical protein